MLKKIALATALLATASFATWDKFPVLEANKGQAEIGANYLIQGDVTQLGLFAQARYTVIPNLELGAAVPFVLFTHWDGDDAKQDGLDNIPVMVRYQFMPIMNAFLDFTVPTGSEDLRGKDSPFGFHFGVQYSQPFGSVLFGSEIGLALETAGDDDTTPPWDMNLGAEAQFPMGMVTPYVGLDFDMLLGKYTYDGDNVGKSHTGDWGIAPYVGANIAINQMMYADVSAAFGIGEDIYGEDTPITRTAKCGVNFYFRSKTATERPFSRGRFSSGNAGFRGETG